MAKFGHSHERESSMLYPMFMQKVNEVSKELESSGLHNVVSDDGRIMFWESGKVVNIRVAGWPRHYLFSNNEVVIPRDSGTEILARVVEEIKEILEL